MMRFKYPCGDVLPCESFATPRRMAAVLVTEPGSIPGRRVCNRRRNWHIQRRHDHGLLHAEHPLQRAGSNPAGYTCSRTSWGRICLETVMAQDKIKASVQNGMLIIALPIMVGYPNSKSGKSRLVAQTIGFKETTATINGQTIKISNISACIPLADEAK
jgi:hypothetical protein